MSIQRLKVFIPADDEALDVVGPFLNNYPTLTLSADVSQLPLLEVTPTSDDSEDDDLLLDPFDNTPDMSLPSTPPTLEQLPPCDSRGIESKEEKEPEEADAPSCQACEGKHRAHTCDLGSQSAPVEPNRESEKTPRPARRKRRINKDSQVSLADLTQQLREHNLSTRGGREQMEDRLVEFLSQHARSLKYLDNQGVMMQVVKQRRIRLRYGDYVVHNDPVGGYTVSQYLGLHQNVPNTHLRLRTLGVTPQKQRTPRGLVWQYLWEARPHGQQIRNKRKLAKVGNSHREPPMEDKPWRPVYEQVVRTSLRQMVHLKTDGTLMVNVTSLIFPVIVTRFDHKHFKPSLMLVVNTIARSPTFRLEGFMRFSLRLILSWASFKSVVWNLS